MYSSMCSKQGERSFKTRKECSAFVLAECALYRRAHVQCTIIKGSLVVRAYLAAATQCIAFEHVGRSLADTQSQLRRTAASKLVEVPVLAVLQCMLAVLLYSTLASGCHAVVQRATNWMFLSTCGTMQNTCELFGLRLSAVSGG